MKERRREQQEGCIIGRVSEEGMEPPDTTLIQQQVE
jgi:hypothetical protein